VHIEHVQSQIGFRHVGIRKMAEPYSCFGLHAWTQREFTSKLVVEMHVKMRTYCGIGEVGLNIKPTVSIP
jgi:Tat protein secretion system quality control protein TatD with DNase activity